MIGTLKLLLSDFRLVLLIIVLKPEVMIAKERTFLAATLEYPPYEFSYNGIPRGIAVDIINEAVRRTDFDVKYEFLPWSRAVFKAKVGQVDILFNAGKNAERQVWGQYSKCVLIMQQYYLFKRRNDAFTVSKDYSDVSDKSIGIRLGYLYGSGAFRKAIDQNKFGRIEYTKSTKQSVDMLLGGRMDMFVGDYMPVMSYIKRHSLEDQIEIVRVSSYTQANLVVLTWPTYLLFNKKKVSPEHIQQIDHAMKEMKEDGFIESVYARYDEGVYPYLANVKPSE